MQEDAATRGAGIIDRDAHDDELQATGNPGERRGDG
jgi:hypothetical protein